MSSGAGGRPVARDDPAPERCAVECRPLTSEQARQLGPALIALGADLNWESWELPQLLAPREMKWELSSYAVVSGEPAGYAVVSKRGDVAHLHHLIVGQRFRGRAVGAALLATVIEQTRRLGFRRVELKVYAINERAISFYERKGFSRGELQDNGLLWMRLDLSVGAGNEARGRGTTTSA